MRTTAITLLAPLLLLGLAACGDTASEAHRAGPAIDLSEADAAYDAGPAYVDEEVELEPPRTAQAPPPLADTRYDAAPGAPPREPVLLRTGTVAFATTDLDSAHRRIAAHARALGAYVAAERESRYGAARHLHLTLRVPADRFAELLARIGDGVAAFDERTIDTRDVTAEYVDLAARLRARRALEERYVALVRRADDVEDVLAVEGQLARVREDIEAAEGQLRYLADRSALSTLDLHVRQPDPDAPVARGGRVVASLAAGWSLLVELALGLLGAWPLALVVGLGAYAWRRRRSGARRSPVA